MCVMYMYGCMDVAMYMDGWMDGWMDDIVCMYQRTDHQTGGKFEYFSILSGIESTLSLKQA